jgi:Na+/H+ antiporter NhaD/arsenite permease-like protein
MPSSRADATLALFILSILCVIRPFKHNLRWIGLPRVHIPIDLLTASIVIIALLWASKCIGATQIRDGIVGTNGIKPYNILILFSSLAYMAITLDITGIWRAATFWVINKGGSNGWKLYFYFYLLLTSLSVIIGNDPIILSGTVFLVYYTQAVELNPLAWLIAEFAAANTASMVLFVGNPTNVVICEGFRVNNVAFTAYTVFPFMGCSVLCFIALAFQFRSSNFIPLRLKKSGHLDPLKALKDPTGAWFGGSLLAACLAVVLIVSFFGVDVWEITLPFALTKCIFDFGWDHYRFKTGRLPKTEEGKSDEEKDEENIVAELQRVFTSPNLDLGEESGKSPLPRAITEKDVSQPVSSAPTESPLIVPDHDSPSRTDSHKSVVRGKLDDLHVKLSAHFPTFFTALPRLPFALVPFAFSQFILIEGLAHQGWIDVFARWLVIASHRQMYAIIWLVGVLGVILCNLSGTNIGATILLTKVMRSAALPNHSARAGAISLAVASNVGAVSFTFSASLAGLLWQGILKQKGITIKQRTFAFWNLLPILVMTVTGLAIVCAEMAVIYSTGSTQ